MKKVFWFVIRILLGLFMVYGGVQHFVQPDFYLPFIPTFLPYPMAIIYASGVVEIVLGITLLLNKKLAKFGAMGVLFLMIIFLPIHIWDIFSETPAIGSHTAAMFRLPIQVLLIAWAWGVLRVLSIHKTNEIKHD